MQMYIVVDYEAGKSWVFDYEKDAIQCAKVREKKYHSFIEEWGPPHIYIICHLIEGETHFLAKHPYNCCKESL